MGVWFYVSNSSDSSTLATRSWLRQYKSWLALFRVYADSSLPRLQRITAAPDNADEEDLQQETADSARRLLPKKQERQSHEGGHEVNPGCQHQLSSATAVVHSPAPLDHDPLHPYQPLADDDDQTMALSRSSTLIAPFTYVYSFHKIKSLGEDPSSWGPVRSWCERKDPAIIEGRKRSAEEMEDEKGLERSHVPEEPDSR